MSNLKGKTVVNTQAEGQNRALNNLLKERGANVISFPAIQVSSIEPDTHIAKQMREIERFDWLVFTSKNGIKSFFESYQQVNNHKLSKSIKIAVIGAKTRNELQKAGYDATFVNPGNTSGDFILYFGQALKNGENVLLALGNLAPDKIAGQLSHKANFERINVYKTQIPENINKDVLAQLKSKIFDWYIFTSPSAFRNFVEITQIQPSAKIHVATIGRTTTNEIEKSGFRVALTASEANIETMVNEMINK